MYYDLETLKDMSNEELKEYARNYAKKFFIDCAVCKDEDHTFMVSAMMCITYRNKMNQVLFAFDSYGEPITLPDYVIIEGRAIKILHS